LFPPPFPASWVRALRLFFKRYFLPQADCLSSLAPLSAVQAPPPESFYSVFFLWRNNRSSRVRFPLCARHQRPRDRPRLACSAGPFPLRGGVGGNSVKVRTDAIPSHWVSAGTPFRSEASVRAGRQGHRFHEFFPPDFEGAPLVIVRPARTAFSFSRTGLYDGEFIVPKAPEQVRFSHGCRGEREMDDVAALSG